MRCPKLTCPKINQVTENTTDAAPASFVSVRGFWRWPGVTIPPRRPRRSSCRARTSGGPSVRSSWATVATLHPCPCRQRCSKTLTVVAKASDRILLKKNCLWKFYVLSRLEASWLSGIACLVTSIKIQHFLQLETESLGIATLNCLHSNCNLCSVAVTPENYDSSDIVCHTANYWYYKS